MKVKRYIVGDLPEAVQMIRSELGSDAVILNTKEIRVGGFLGMFRKKKVEVIAAVDEGTKKPSPPRKPMPAARLPDRAQPTESKAVSPMLTESFSDVLSLNMPSQAVRDRYSQSTQPAQPPAKAAPVARADRPVATIEPGPVFTAAATAMKEPAPFVAPRQAEPAASDQAETLAIAVKALEARETRQAQQMQQDETSALLQELRSMKEMMTKLTKQQTYRGMPESVLRWSRRLAEQGVDPAYVEQFAEAVNERLEGNEDDYATYVAAKNVLLSWLDAAKGEGIEETTRIVHFVGPTGVGKTTTIAKIAAEQSLSRKRTVGLITADTYRIAAVDQLRTYADILNIPLEVVFSPAELARAYKKLADRDLLCMDTAGRNYRNELFVSEVNSLLSPGERTETILVLSMTHKYGDMKSVATQFAKYGVNQLLLTKFDETDTYGSIVNLAREFPFRISYITCGQTVPDDIKPYDPEDLVRKLLGDSAHE